MNVLWFRPNKPANISVGRHRIGVELEKRGHDVEIRNTTLADFRGVVSESPDVIVGTTRLGAFVGAWKKTVSGTPLVVDHIDPVSQLRRSHDPVTTWTISQAEKLAFRVADHVMVVYQEELQRVNAHAGRTTETSLGVDYERFAEPPVETVQSARETVMSHVPVDSRVLLYVGGLESTYNLPTIVDAVEQLEGWDFVVLGDGSQSEWLETVAADRDTIHYLGTVPYEDVPGYMHVADVGISLLDDPHTLKVLEYGAAGLPVVHLEGSAESVFQNSVTFCSLDSSDVACAVQQAVSEESEDLQEFARQRSWQSVARDYEQVLESVIE